MQETGISHPPCVVMETQGVSMADGDAAGAPAVMRMEKGR